MRSRHHVRRHHGLVLRLRIPRIKAMALPAWPGGLKAAGSLSVRTGLHGSERFWTTSGRQTNEVSVAGSRKRMERTTP